MSSPFVYQKMCNYCEKVKGIADFVQQRGRPTTQCLECRRKANKSKNPPKSRVNHPWNKDSRKTLERLKKISPTKYLNHGELE